MEIVNTAIAGTLESSDAQVMVEPAAKGIELILESSVINQYGKQIRKTILETLERLDVKNVKISVIDKGALDCKSGMRRLPLLPYHGTAALGRCHSMNPDKNRLRRTMMFLNCQKPGLIKDPYIYEPDSIILDLEDAVAANQKDSARYSLYHAL